MVSFVVENNFNQQVTDETFINRINFKEFVLVTDELESEKIEDALIEIVSPVLKKGNYKWRGVYNDATISFNMKSNEFKTLVQTGQVEFKNGSSINCLLEIKRRINNEGLIEITDYNIIRVDSYFEHNKTIETSEGNQYRKKVEADKNQMNLFNSENKDE